MQFLVFTFFMPGLALLFQEATEGRFAVAWQKAQHPDLSKFLIIGALLFIIGVAGVLTRRNIIVIFMSIELILNAVNINLIAFSAQLHNVVGQVFAIFVIAVAAAEAAVGLGIILAFYRNKETVNIDEMNLMRW